MFSGELCETYSERMFYLWVEKRKDLWKFWCDKSRWWTTTPRQELLDPLRTAQKCHANFSRKLKRITVASLAVMMPNEMRKSFGPGVKSEDWKMGNIFTVWKLEIFQASTNEPSSEYFQQLAVMVLHPRDGLWSRGFFLGTNFLPLFLHLRPTPRVSTVMYLPPEVQTTAFE